jgi:hypothetical protein
MKELKIENNEQVTKVELVTKHLEEAGYKLIEIHENGLIYSCGMVCGDEAWTSKRVDFLFYYGVKSEDVVKVTEALKDIPGVFLEGEMAYLRAEECPETDEANNRIYIGEHAAVAYAQDLLKENLPLVLQMAEYGVKASVAPYLLKERS